MASERRSESLTGIFFGGYDSVGAFQARSRRPLTRLSAGSDTRVARRAELTRERRTKHTSLKRWYRFPATLRGSSGIVGARIVSLMQNWK